MQVEFNTREYEFSHGKKPRGFGVWCFFFGNVMQDFNGTYTQAKQAAKEYAKQVNCHEVVVGA